MGRDYGGDGDNGTVGRTGHPWTAGHPGHHGQWDTSDNLDTRDTSDSTSARKGPPALARASTHSGAEREQRSGLKSNFRVADLLEPEPCASRTLFAETSLKLVHVEIPPDDEVSRVSRADLFLEHIGCGMEFASSRPKNLFA